MINIITAKSLNYKKMNTKTKLSKLYFNAKFFITI